MAIIVKTNNYQQPQNFAKFSLDSPKSGCNYMSYQLAKLFHYQINLSYNKFWYFLDQFCREAFGIYFFDPFKMTFK